MSSVSTYLNFAHQAEEAFTFYKSIFGGDFTSFQRFSDVPNLENRDQMSETDLNCVMHVELPIVGGHVLMGTDAPKSMGFTVKSGNNMYINLQIDSRAEFERIFAALSAEAKIEMEPQEMFWGDIFASFTDKFGINWMMVTSAKA